MSVKNYFDHHSHHIAYHNDPKVYQPIMSYLKEIDSSVMKKILDFGCGDGHFIKYMIENGFKAEFYGSDISFSMINLAKKKLQNHQVELFIADGFKMPLKSGSKFDIIHVDMILHHLIGKTRSESIQLVHRMLGILMNMLSEKGILIIEEHISASYFIPSLAPIIVFYGLKLINFLRLDVSKIANEIQPGLEVNFFHEGQLKKILEKYGRVQRIRKKTVKPPRLRRVLLVKEVGVMSFVVKKGQPN